MKNVIVAALSSAALLAAGSSMAAPGGWQLVVAQGAETVFFQPKSVNVIQDGLEVSVMEDFRETEFLGTPVLPHKSRVSTYRVDCDSAQAGLAAWTLYSANFGQGDVVWSDKSEEVAMFRAASEPAVERLVQRVCAPFLARR
jgi:hypothetical protein